MQTKCRLFLGDCMEEMKRLPDASVDSVVTDPPYGIRFMGEAWDGSDIDAMVQSKVRKGTKSTRPKAGTNAHEGRAFAAGTYDVSLSGNRAFQEWTQQWAAEAFRVLKPGGYLLSFAAPRTYHRMTSGIEDAGFDIRDQIMWLFGSGFPKSHNLTGEHEGWGTALKPAHEPIVVARKPFKGTIAANVQRHGTGAMNIKACRIETEETLRAGSGAIPCRHDKDTPRQAPAVAQAPGVDGRWPANVIHDGSEAATHGMPAEAGAFAPVRGTEPSAQTQAIYGQINRQASNAYHHDTGSAARFFYCAKASKEDRDEGLDGMAMAEAGMKNASGRGTSESDPYRKVMRRNTHPTVKPTDLMRYLVRLVTPKGGTVLDPFVGSGSTGKAAAIEGCHFIGIEKDTRWLHVAEHRIRHAQGSLFSDVTVA